MPVSIIKQFNWFDILILILLFRIGYTSLKGGFPVAFFKFLGTVSAIYFSLHYYVRLTEVLLNRFALDRSKFGFIEFTIFLILVIICFLLFALLRKAFMLLIKIEAVSNLNRWGGLIIGILNGVLICGLLSFTLFISNINYLGTSVKNSYLGNYFFKAAPDTYTFLWNNIGSKFMVREGINENVANIREVFYKK